MFERVDENINAFSWRQQAEYFKVFVPLPNPNLKSKDLIVDISSKHLRASIRGGAIFVDIDLAIEIIPTDNDWTLKRGHIVFKLTKQSPIDLKFSFYSPIQFSNKECTEFKDQPSPLQNETKSDYFSLVRNDIIDCHAKYVKMCEEFPKSSSSSTTTTSSSDPQHDMDEETREQRAEELFKIATKEEENTDNILEVYNMYKEAADLGHGPSREKFARLCLIDENNEFGIVPSPELAFHYMKMAAIENDSHTALFQLGNYFMKGIGTEKNYENALICFVEHTIIDGNPTSMFNIGVLYHEGGSGGNGQAELFNRNYNKAYVWWKIALNRGHALSAYNIGILLKSGDGVDKSLVKAFQYFKLANFMSEKIQIPTDVLIAIQEQQFNVVFKGEDEVEHDSPTDSNNQIDETEEARNMDFMDEKPFKEFENNLLASEEEEEEEFVDEELDITSKSSRSRSPFNSTTQNQDATTSTTLEQQENEDMEEILRQLSESNGKVSPKTNSKSSSETSTSSSNNSGGGAEPSIGWKVAEYALTIGAVIGMGFLLKRSTEFH